MIRKVAILGLSGLSLVMTLAFMAAWWHPVHVSNVWDQGAHWLDFQGGGARYFYEEQRNRIQGSTIWTSSDHFLLGLGFRTTSDGFTLVRAPGVSFEWCRQASGYRRFDLSVGLFQLAVLAALYPALSLSIGRVRRAVRRRHGRCIKCGYDLKGNVSGVCPECGTKIGRELRG